MGITMVLQSAGSRVFDVNQMSLNDSVVVVVVVVYSSFTGASHRFLGYRIADHRLGHKVSSVAFRR